jgi:hypothetical protein
MLKWADFTISVNVIYRHMYRHNKVSRSKLEQKCEHIHVMPEMLVAKKFFMHPQHKDTKTK